MKRPITITLASAIVILCFLNAAALWAETPEPRMTLAPGKTVTSQEESVISLAAAKALYHVALARAAIFQKDEDRAIREIKRSLMLMDSIKRALPTVKAKDYIRVAIIHLSYEDPKAVIQDLIPIYASLDDIEDLVAVDNTRGHIDKAKKNLEAENREGARKEFELADHDLVDTETDFPLAHAESQVIKAYAYLVENDSGQANRALKEAEDGVRFIGISIYSPIGKTRRALRQSSEDMVAGKLEAVREDLEQAKAYLEQAIKSGDLTIKAEAEKLSQDVSAAEDQLQKKSEKTASEITALWEKAEALSERSAEYIFAGWEELGVKSRTEVNLIEARLHVAYAQIYQETTGQLEKARLEMDEADGYLEKAKENADEKTKVRLDAIVQELKEAKLQFKEKGPAVTTRYERIKGELRDILRKM